MHGQLSVDVAAWTSTWRYRAVADKVVLALGLLIAALALPALPGSIIVFVVAFILAVGPGGAPWKLMLRAGRIPIVFIVMASVPVAFTLFPPGGGFIALADGGPMTALRLALHAISGTTVIMMFASTTPMIDVFNGLRRLHIPDPAIEVASLMYRMLFILLATMSTIREAQSARLGYSNLWRGMHSAAALVSTLLVRSWSRARRLQDGMAGRGMENSMRTLDDSPRTSWPFIAASLVGIAAIVGVSLALGSLG